MKNLIFKKLGFSTIEILITFAVGIIFLTAAMMVAFSDPTLARQISLNTSYAAALDTALDGSALATSTNKIGKLVADVSSNWNILVSNDTDNFYTNVPEVTDIAPCLKEITNATTWSTLSSRERSMTFGTALSNMSAAIALGPGGCDPLPPSEWNNPESSNLAQANVSGADNGTDIVVKSINGKRYAFITTNPQGGGASKKEFTVIDVSDTSVENGDIKATLPMDKGLLGVAIAGDYAYVLNNDVTNHIQIINVSDPEAPIKLSTSITLPNITCNYHNQNCQRIPRSIAYYGGYLFIGTGYMVGNSPELHVYCVDDSSVPGCSFINPVSRGRLNLNHNINDIVIKDNYAYLATSADYGELTVIDITSKTSPISPPTYADPSTNNRKYNAVTTQGTASTEDGTSVYVLGTYLYLGREKVNNQNEREFYVLDISSPSAIIAKGVMSLGIGNNTRLSDIVVQSKTAFVSTTDSNQSLFIINVSNPATPQKKNNCSGFNTSQGAIALDYNDNLIFLAHTQGSTLLKIVYDQGNVCTQ